MLGKKFECCALVMYKNNGITDTALLKLSIRGVNVVI